MWCVKIKEPEHFMLKSAQHPPPTLVRSTGIANTALPSAPIMIKSGSDSVIYENHDTFGVVSSHCNPSITQNPLKGEAHY